MGLDVSLLALMGAELLGPCITGPSHTWLYLRSLGLSGANIQGTLRR